MTFQATSRGTANALECHSRLLIGPVRLAAAAKAACQIALTRIGPLCSPRLVFALNRAVDYLEAGRWMHERGFRGPRLAERSDLFDLIGREVADERVLYLEFGVSYGASMRYWSALLRNPEAMLHGFDSFDGLPERWNELNERGTFSTGGIVPTFADARIKLFRGLFSETLPSYDWPDHERLVVNMDADLYSSTKQALDCIAPMLRPGSFVYFDELMDRDHELRAFDEFLDEHPLTFVLRAATRNLSAAVFQRVENPRMT